MPDARDAQSTAPTFPLVDADVIASLRFDPPRLGELASTARDAHFGARIELRAAQESGTRAWPEVDSLRPGQCVALEVEASDEGAHAWLNWLDTLAQSSVATQSLASPLRVAPYTETPAGTFRLWAIAAARLRLPATVRVEARHDLVGIRLAQVALRFGADTLAGPIDADRHLPLAGVTRPNENTHAGLFALIEQCGLEPVDAPGVVEAAAPLTSTPVVPPQEPVPDANEISLR